MSGAQTLSNSWVERLCCWCHEWLQYSVLLKVKNKITVMPPKGHGIWSLMAFLKRKLHQSYRFDWPSITLSLARWEGCHVALRGCLSKSHLLMEEAFWLFLHFQQCGSYLSWFQFSSFLCLDLWVLCKLEWEILQKVWQLIHFFFSYALPCV